MARKAKKTVEVKPVKAVKAVVDYVEEEEGEYPFRVSELYSLDDKECVFFYSNEVTEEELDEMTFEIIERWDRE